MDHCRARAPPLSPCIAASVRYVFPALFSIQMCFTLFHLFHLLLFLSFCSVRLCSVQCLRVFFSIDLFIVSSVCSLATCNVCRVPNSSDSFLNAHETHGVAGTRPCIPVIRKAPATVLRSLIPLFGCPASTSTLNDNENYFLCLFGIGEQCDVAFMCHLFEIRKVDGRR